MSPISSNDLQRIFKNLDKNNNGQINIQDLHHLLDKIRFHTTLEDLENLVGKSALDYNDFLFFYEMVNAKIAENDNHDHVGDDLLKTFKVFDLNGDGYISCDELQSVLSRLGLLDKQSRGDCRDMICVFDKNDDGVLDFEEFKDMMYVPSPSNSDSNS